MMPKMDFDSIIVLDFGSQYTQLVAKTIRELGVFAEVLDYHTDISAIKDKNPKGIVLSGGPESVYATTGVNVSSEIYLLGIPVLGICYGLQSMVQTFGGKVESIGKREGGSTLICNLKDNLLTGKAGEKHLVWMSHDDQVSQLPQDFDNLATSEQCPYVSVQHVEKPFYGLQFHPEVTHTKIGKKILENFIYGACKCKFSWSTSLVIEDILNNIRTKVGNDRVVLGLSGGVDSAVVAMLLHRAIGDQLTCVFVDTGLLRLDEATQLLQIFEKTIGINVIVHDAQYEFLRALANVADPEEKRKIIGKCFIDAFESSIAHIHDVKWLAQGTIYSDVIESAGVGSATKKIKSHHNVGGIPDNMQLHLLEPVRFLFKDEVRKLGLELGLPEELIKRHPFPGPGLGVRILGAIKVEYIRILQQADAIFIEELHRNGLYYEVSQAFAVFIPLKSVGVSGDNRVYDYIIALRAVDTVDFMTANWKVFPSDFLSLVSGRILNEVKGVSRVTYDISNKPPATIEWE